MSSALFDFFEAVVDELIVDPTRVLTREAFESGEDQGGILQSLRSEMNVLRADEAIEKAVALLSEHFKARDSALPFSYDKTSGMFTATDMDYLVFIRLAKELRSVGKRAKEFEIGALERIKLRIVGSVHRVGHPRTTHKKRKDFNKYLERLGFNGEVAIGNEKDGGLDILWVLPFGAVPHRPVVSVQCKNGPFKLGDGDKSIGASRRSMNQHRGLMAEAHMFAVLFNDYVVPKHLPKKALNWIPLGLSDLAMLQEPPTSYAI